MTPNEAMNLKKKLIDTPIPRKPPKLENPPDPGRRTFYAIAFSTVTAIIRTQHNLAI
jgi:hypothetical protein